MSAVLAAETPRVLSGMRPTGPLHLGHYHGVLKNWVKLQTEYDCYFFVADWHALTTDYDKPEAIGDNAWGIVLEWLAAGIDPNYATIFIQSRVPQHAELHTLLSMITPLSWLERVPSYKEQQEQLKDKDLATYGFLGYPLLQSADILVYRASYVPVGEDQVPHVELTREVARRFNHLYGRDADYEQLAEEAIGKLGRKNAKLYRDLRVAFLERGERDALERARALLERQKNISLGDKERLYGYLEGGGKIILPEPQPLLTPASKMPGLDGRKMSKSYGNTIGLRDDPRQVEEKMRTMPTDPARVRRTDPGDPDKCPVWQFHLTYSDEQTQAWAREGCKTAGIGCLDCKRPAIEAVLNELAPIRARAEELARDPATLELIVTEGTRKARAVAEATLEEVRAAMGLAYT